MWSRRRITVRLPFVALVMTVAACGMSADGQTTTTTAATSTTTTSVAGEDAGAVLAEARSRWTATDIDTYHFTFHDDCGECMPTTPRPITVWDATVYDGTQQGIDVDALFELIEAALADGRSVDVVYHPELGYPTDLWIDREARAYDGGTHLLVTDLRPGLPGTNVAVADLDRALALWQQMRPAAYEFRTDIVCGCPFDVTTWTAVDGERIVDWTVEQGDADVAPVTIDELFADLRELVATGEVVEGGARITGNASYDPTFGYPIWVGLDIEILDLDSEFGELPPRLVFTVRDFTEREATGSQLEAAMRRWSEVGPADYSYELTVHDVVEGSFSDPYVVTVTNGQVTSVTQNGDDIHPGNLPAYTVDDLFRRIDEWQGLGFAVETLFDTRLGHPVVVSLDTGTEIEFFSIASVLPR